MVCVDKYLAIILTLLVGGMIFSIVKNPPSLELFYAQLAGAIIIIIYSSFKNRKQQQSSKKKR
jgi:zinc transporter ZupT